MSETIMRGALRKCPRCGMGNMFSGYLKPVGNCAACGEALGHIRADDGPAWLTILLVGHILAPFMLGVVPNTSWPVWEILAVVMSATLLLSAAILPRSKGIFIALIWRAGCAGSEKP